MTGSIRKIVRVLSWLATIAILIGALLASFLPENYWHHPFFIFGNGLLAVSAWKKKQLSVFILGFGLTVIYIVGISISN